MFKAHQWVEYKGDIAFIINHRGDHCYIRVFRDINTDLQKSDSLTVPTSELTELAVPTFELGQTVVYQGADWGNVKPNSIATIMHIDHSLEYPYQLQQDDQTMLVCPFEIRAIEY